MATTSEVTAAGVGVDSTAQAGGNIFSEKTLYRGYVQLDAKGEPEKFFAKAESANQSSWKAMETEEAKKEGKQLLNQNEFVRYNVKDMAGAQLLVPDTETFVQIFQAGLNYKQNSLCNQLSTELTENGDGLQGSPIIPKYNDQTIDLREYINEPVSARKLSPMDKAMRDIQKAGLSPDMIALLVDQLQQRMVAMAAQQAAITSEQGESEAEEQGVTA